MLKNSKSSVKNKSEKISKFLHKVKLSVPTCMSDEKIMKDKDLEDRKNTHHV